MRDCLNSEQSLSGQGPSLTPGQMAGLGSLMGSLYLQHMESLTLHAARPVWGGSAITFMFGNRWPMLIFRDEGILVQEERVERRLMVVGGFWMRRDCPPGRLTFTASYRALSEHRSEWTASVRVESFGSAWLGMWGRTRPKWIGRLMAGAYERIHAYASYGYLQKLYVKLEAGDVFDESPAPAIQE